MRAELMTAQAVQAVAVAEELPKASKLKTALKPRRKRRANEMSDDEPVLGGEPVLHTPQQVEARPKRPLKKSLSQTIVGEKSAFSITPFLNKTINFADTSIEFTAGGGGTKIFEQEKSASSELESSGDSMAAQLSQPVSTSTPVEPTIRFSTQTTKVPLKGPKPRGRPPKAKILGETSASKKNLTASLRKAFLSEPTLDRVMEEADDPSPDQENQSLEATSSFKLKDATMTVKMSDASAMTSSLEPELKKKKRKLLGGAAKTLFGADDEVDAAAAAAPPS